MQNKQKKNAWIPSYAVFPLLSCVTVNCIVYFGISKIANEWKHYDLTLPFDRAVPLVPGFVSIYLGCYLFIDWFSAGIADNDIHCAASVVWGCCICGNHDCLDDYIVYIVYIRF